MKVYISADIEGTAGIASWSATNLGDPEHRAAAQEMTLEAVAACQGALDAGATELYVKDAHDSGRNMDLSLFPREAKDVYKRQGYMCTGWVQDGGKWYYMDGSGVMLANTTTPDGKYWLDANGVWDGKTIGSSNAASSLERNTMQATIDGVEETFYLTSTG